MTVGDLFVQTEDLKDDEIMVIDPALASTGTIEIQSIAGSGGAEIFHDASTSLGSAYDISTFVPGNLTYNITASNGATWSDNGSVLFTVDNTFIRKHTTTRPYDISLLSQDSVSSFGRFDKQSVLTNNDGTRLYELSENTIRQASLSSANEFDEKLNLSLDVTVQNAGNDNGANEIAWNDNGTRFYRSARKSNNLEQQTALTPFDIQTLQSPTTEPKDSSNAYGFTWKPDGIRFWEIDYSNDRYFQYDVPSAYDITARTNRTIHSNISSGAMGLTWSDDGTKFVEISYRNNRLYQADVDTAFDLTDYSYNNVSFNPGFSKPNDMQWNDDGTRFFLSSYNQSYFAEYRVPEPYDISGAQKIFRSNIGIQGTSDYGATTWNNDGTKWYSEDQNGLLEQYTADQPYKLKYLFDTEFAAQDPTSTGLAWNDDGSKLYETGASNGTIYEYTLSTPFDISTASVSTSISSQDTVPTGLAWKPDGTKMYEVGNDQDNIYEYLLAAPYDLSTATFNTSTNTDGNDVQDIFWDDTGDILFETNENGVELTTSQYDQRIEALSFGSSFYSQQNKIEMNDTMRLVIRNTSGSENAYTVTGIEISS